MTSFDNQLKTYRYLRIAMILVILMLAASVVVELVKTDSNCLQSSLSAYYHTPAQSIFVGTLVAIGACMVVLRGSTDWENIWLNLAGILAPIVAFVPTSGVGSCRSTPVAPRDASADIANNMVALFVAGGFGLVLAAIVIHSARADGSVAPRERLLRQTVGVGLGAGIPVGTVLWFGLDRSSFDSGAHFSAAVTLFVCIIIVVYLNACYFSGLTRCSPFAVFVKLTNRYSMIVRAMVLVPVGMLVYWAFFEWDHLVFGMEAALIILFAIFWGIQTRELWYVGDRATSTGDETAA